ncbi:MAG: class I SAM-dependent methyltransferase [Bacteroidota bacterium]|nr:class I SAM-dependent methyltransferase [Bacteroidota bacterium]MDP4196738.1 class I SAM-dependent methyltransferase [Bacteroidota bacterium]
MTSKTSIELGSVQSTLLLPLWGRAIETKKRNPLLKDETAVRIIEQVDYDFAKVAPNIHDITQFEWICRSIHIDKAIRELLQRHPKATIVNIGCGLDTSFDRVDNGKLYWYDLDLPDVIELRRKFILENERRKFIACSFLDDSWFKQIHVEDSILFMAAGVLYYLEETKLKDIFKKLSCAFPSAEFIFDAASAIGVKTANQKLLGKVGLDERSFMKWSIESSEELKNWDIKFDFIKEFLMFKNMKKSLSLRNKFVAYLSDHYKMMYMIHLRFK